MKGGAISGNTATMGGGVNMEYASGAFTMSGGSISGNTAETGGGVYMAGFGTITKSGKGGIIYGSNAEGDLANRARSDDQGHAMFMPTISKKRNTTARAATAMDSTKDGPAGGWE
jgi:hypothetical protein